MRAELGDVVGALRDLHDGIQSSQHAGERPSLAGAIGLGIGVLAHTGRTRAAAILSGVIHSGPLSHVFNGLLAGPERSRLDAVIAMLRTRLGAAEFEALAARGAAMTYDDVVAYTLTALEPSAVEPT
jgi:hypothetical protein